MSWRGPNEKIVEGINGQSIGGWHENKVPFKAGLPSSSPFAGAFSVVDTDCGNYVSFSVFLDRIHRTLYGARMARKHWRIK